LYVANSIDDSETPITIEQDESVTAGTQGPQTDEEFSLHEDIVSSSENFYQQETLVKSSFDYSDVLPYSGEPVCIINDNKPFFCEDDLKQTECFENYSNFDSLGRCGVAIACIGTECMPTEERGSIGMVKPSGWHIIKYDFIDGKYLYNRCHLIGYQLAGENALEENLITGTRYLNVEGMLPYENMVANYVSSSYNHVLYRVTPVFVEENLVADGVLMEGMSLEDEGKGLCFCVFAYNVQPGVNIDYLTGDSSQQTESELLEIYGDGVESQESLERFLREDQSQVSQEELENITYIGNRNSHRFHYPDCDSVSDMKDKNKVFFYGGREEDIDAGYSPCGRCNP
jgi:DNA-entry nuclease